MANHTPLLAFGAPMPIVQPTGGSVGARDPTSGTENRLCAKRRDSMPEASRCSLDYFFAEASCSTLLGARFSLTCRLRWLLRSMRRLKLMATLVASTSKMAFSVVSDVLELFFFMAK